VLDNDRMASAAYVVFFIILTCCPAEVSLLFTRDPAAHDIPVQFAVTRSDVHAPRYGEETTSKQVTFREPVSNTEMDDPESEGNQNEGESSANWTSGNPPYTTAIDDPGSSYSPFLPPVLEEPSSSFSEGNIYYLLVLLFSLSTAGGHFRLIRFQYAAADDDPLPAVENLQISGEAFPGRELQANGYSINGTTSCNFEVHFSGYILESVSLFGAFSDRNLLDPP
jgi:hypothetical protein